LLCTERASRAWKNRGTKKPENPKLEKGEKKTPAMHEAQRAKFLQALPEAKLSMNPAGNVTIERVESLNMLVALRPTAMNCCQPDPLVTGYARTGRNGNEHKETQLTENIV
jgi:hypothetical protein